MACHLLQGQPCLEEDWEEIGGHLSNHTKLSEMASVQRERAFEQGQFRLQEVTPTSGRKKAISDPMLWNARERKTSDSPKPAPGIQKSRALEGKMPSCEF